MNPAERKRIAALFPRRFDSHYVASKLRTDPVYAALEREIRESELPLLDLGCGLGLVAFCLRSANLNVPISGIDYDQRKIAMAHRAAKNSGDRGLSFGFHDLRTGVPDHCGNVCILDILQYFDPNEQQRILNDACARVAPGGKLVIRSGLRDDSLRFRFTQLGDLLAKVTFWMKSAPTHFPKADDLRRCLSPHGLVRIAPLWGNTPFNNHLIVLEKPIHS
jgi:SAM-dependent methyltransferase